MAKSSKASAQRERDSVYDFLYHDPRRIASFLSQFNAYGHLQSLSRSQSTSKTASSTSRVGGRAGIPPLASVDGGGEEAASESTAEGLTETYDPLWANALALLDHLTDHNLIHRDIAKAGIGQFVLVSGRLDILNLGTLRSVWDDTPVRDLIVSAVQPEDGGETEAGLAVIRHLPHSILAFLGGTHPVWCSLQGSGMTTPADDLLLKHGAVVGRGWSLLGILDARPSASASSASPMGSPESIVQFMRFLAPLVRGMLGRPSDHYGVTPLLIFREVGQIRRSPRP